MKVFKFEWYVGLSCGFPHGWGGGGLVRLEWSVMVLWIDLGHCELEFECLV